ncbi:uncharacterized protein B0T15DRAFT_505975 [Chaetomium strumarium]|uniref:Uncharacterized protein n=1 Tax=Chaetomium strumarium TaxID=1170767 RepID=A0AAJ0LXZ1_9PEZI|nr:hypothetical protein B0T15DRAFT_505975 [Chaetomium strumarium]
MAEPLRPKFLEVCVNTGEFEKRLTEVNMLAVNSDTKLFQDIKEEYQSVRSFRARYFLLKPVDVHFVRFSLENGYRVGIHDKPQSIPDQREMKDHGYGYDPCPMMPMPPVPANIFLHHLLKPEGHPRRVWCGRLPQKLDRSIHQSTRDGDTLAFGWGVHIIEGPHKFNILLTMLIILLSTTVVSVTWAGVREDVQGGFGIGAFLIGAQTLILMMVLAKWAET